MPGDGRALEGPAPGHPSVPAARFANPGAQHTLEQFRGSDLLASGKLNVVALEAIAERLGERWATRRDLVHEHALRTLRSAIGVEGLVQRISDTEYLVAQPQTPRAAGQLRCIRALDDILAHFLGDANVADVRVHVVTRIADDGVYGQRLLPGEVEVAEASERAEVSAEPAAAASLDRWTPFTTASGQPVAVSCALEPVIHLKSSRRIGYRVASRVQRQPGFAALSSAEFEHLAPIDIEKIDMATIARGLDRLRLGSAHQKPPSLILPIAHLTLQTRRGRANIFGLLRTAREFVAHGIICEITGLEGAPAASLQESIAALRPFGLHIIGRLRTAAGDDARHLMGVGLDGLSLRCHAQARSELVAGARAFVRANGRVAKTFLLYQVPNLELARAAAELGITHATLAPQRLKVLLLDDEPE